MTFKCACNSYPLSSHRDSNFVDAIGGIHYYQYCLNALGQIARNTTRSKDEPPTPRMILPDDDQLKDRPPVHSLSGIDGGQTNAGSVTWSDDGVAEYEDHMKNYPSCGSGTMRELLRWFHRYMETCAPAGVGNQYIVKQLMKHVGLSEDNRHKSEALERSAAGYARAVSAHTVTIAADRLFSFCAGLNLQDHPVKEQRAFERVMREMKAALRPDKAHK